jgi:hypothetical protein
MKLKNDDRREKRSFLVDCLLPWVKSVRNAKSSSVVKVPNSLSPYCSQNLERISS